jgi:RES domain
MTFDECDHQFEKVRAASSLSEACFALEPLFDAYEVVSIELARGNSIFWRARIAESCPWTSIEKMGCPPAQQVVVGRLNDRYIPCFYSATRENTALAEISVKEGDFVQLAGFRPMVETPIRVAVIGDLYHTYKTGYLRITGSDPGLSVNRYINELGKESGERILYIDAFLASLLADTNARKINYILSRAIGSMIYRNTDIDGIFFPSVRDSLGMNLVLKYSSFDSKVLPVCCIHSRVNKLRSFGFIDYDVLQDVEQISDEGGLVWLKSQDKFIRRFFNLTKEEYDSALTSK